MRYGELADYSRCFCNVETLKVQLHFVAVVIVMCMDMASVVWIRKKFAKIAVFQSIVAFNLSNYYLFEILRLLIGIFTK